MIEFLSRVTFLGSAQFVITLSFVVILALAFKKHFRYILPFLFILISSQATISALKYVVDRPRPLDPLISVEDPYSFPSGHANIALVFYFALAFLINKEYIEKPHTKHFVWGVAFGIALLIGVSRVYLRAHFIEDVVVGYAVGVFWLYATWHLFLKRQAGKRNFTK